MSRIGCSMVLKQLPKQKSTKKQRLAKKAQKARIARENELWEMIQLPNGDFKKVKRNINLTQGV